MSPQKTPEVLSREVIDALRESSSTVDELNSLLDTISIQDPEREELRESFTSLTSKELDVIDSNLKRLRDRSELGAHVSVQLNTLSTLILAEQTGRFQGGHGKKAKPGFLDRTKKYLSDQLKVGQEWFSHPENRAKMEKVGVYTGVAIGMYATYRLTRWLLWGKKKKDTAPGKKKGFFRWPGIVPAASAVPAAARAGATNLKTLLAIGALGIGTLLGINFFRKQFMETLQGVQNTIASLQERKKALEGEIASATGKAKEALEAELRRTDERLRQAREQARKLEEAARSEETKKKTREVTRRAEEVAEETGEVAKAKFLPLAVVKLMEGATLGGRSDRSKALNISEIIFRNTEKQVTMRDVLACVSGDEASPEIHIQPPFFITFEGDVESKETRKQGADILLSFCYKNYARLLNTLVQREGLTPAQAEEKINAMSIQEYIEAVLGSISSAAALVAELEEGEGTLLEKIQRMDIKKYAGVDIAVQGELRRFATTELELTDDELAELNPAELIKLSFDVREFGPTVSSAADVNVPEDAPLEKRLLSRIFKELRDGNTYKYLIPAFHGVFPTSEGIDEEQLVKRYLLTRMPLDKAVRLFLYRNMMDQGHATGLFFLQMEIIKFIADEDETFFLKTKKVEVIDAIVGKLLKSSADDLAENWEKYGINVPPEVFEQGWSMLQMSLRAGVKAVQMWYVSWAEIIAGSAKRHPYEIAAGFTGSALAYRFFVGQRMNAADIKINLARWAGTHQHNALLSQADRYARRLDISGYVISQSDDIVECSSSYAKIFDAINDNFDTVPKRTLMEMLRKASLSTHNNFLWTDLATQLRTTGFDKAADACDKFAGSIKLRGVLNRSLYKTTGLLRSWFGLKKPVFLSFRLHNSILDTTLGRAMHAPAYWRRVATAVNLTDDAQRIGRFKALMHSGTTVEELLFAGARAEELITLVDDIDDIQTVFIHLSKAKKVELADTLVNLLKTKTPVQLADAGADMAELLHVMDEINAAKKGTFAVEVIDEVSGIAKSPTYLSGFIENLSLIEDEAVRASRLQNFIKVPGVTLDDLVKSGAAFDDLLAAGAKSDELIDMALKLDDIALRQAAMGELVRAGHLDDVRAACTTKGADAVSELDEILKSAEVTEARAAAVAVETLMTPEMYTKLLEKFGDTLTVKNFDDFLKWAKETGAVDADVLAALKGNRTAQKVFIGAVETGELTEVNRVLSAAKGAKTMKVMKVLGAVGFAGDAFGMYMAWVDYQANKGRIDQAQQTKNKALQDLYEQANLVYGAEGLSSAAGFSVGGYAMVTAMVGGESITTALATAGGTILLPVAVATISGRYIYNKAEGVAETWLRTSKDWVKVLTPGQMLEKLKELGPGQSSYWQGWGKGTTAEQGFRKIFTSRESYQEWEEGGQRTIESANEGTRYELTKAYVLSTSMLAQHEGETDKEFEKRFDHYVMDQMYYLGVMTQGSYSYLMGEGYERARHYARLMGKSRALQAAGESETFTWEDSEGKTHTVDLATFVDLPRQKHRAMDQETILQHYIIHSKQSTVVQFNVMQQMKTSLSEEQKVFSIKHQLIMECQDDIRKLEGRITSTDFTGVLSGEALGEAYARYVASKLFKEALEKHTRGILSKAKSPEGFSVEEYNEVVRKLRVILETDPLKLQGIARERGYYREGYVVDPASVRNALTLRSLLKFASDEAEWMKVKESVEKSIKESSPEEKSDMRHNAGDSYGIKNGMNGKWKYLVGNDHPEYLYVKYGNVLNKNLYAKFIGGKWKVALGGGAEGPWHDPASYRAGSSFLGFSETVASKYNHLIRGFAKINSSY